MTPPAAATPAPSAPAEAAAGEVTLNIQGMAFQPASMTVKAGSTVTWVNNDSAPHTVTSTDGGPLASGTLNRGSSYSVTLDQPGTYNYVCKFHPRMRASIVVQ
ncbi:MAG: cupredoxin family copper-binding protein [Gammaproteobacteria bacterium]|nr:cupredoxin family copper-binding protein [Gammaproteobacteria bacterium]